LVDDTHGWSEEDSSLPEGFPSVERLSRSVLTVAREKPMRSDIHPLGQRLLARGRKIDEVQEERWKE